MRCDTIQIPEPKTRVTPPSHMEPKHNHPALPPPSDRIRLAILAMAVVTVAMVTVAVVTMAVVTAAVLGRAVAGSPSPTISATLAVSTRVMTPALLTSTVTLGDAVVMVLGMEAALPHQVLLSQLAEGSNPHRSGSRMVGAKHGP